MKTHSEAIRSLIKKTAPIAVEVVRLYLIKKFNIPMNSKISEQAIHAAERDGYCFIKDGFVCLDRNTDITTHNRHMSKALRVALEIEPSGESLLIGNNPGLISFVKNGKFVQICVIEPDMEYAMSSLLAATPVPKDERASIRRIAIVETGSKVDRIKAAGITTYCRVNDAYGLSIDKSDASEEAWADVPESK